MDHPKNTVDATAELIKLYYRPGLLDIDDPSGPGSARVLMVPGIDGFTAKSVKPFLDEFRDHPERRAGTATLTALQSLIDHANRFRDYDSVLFAHDDPKAPSLTAVLDYHQSLRAAGTAESIGDNMVIAPPTERPDALPRFGKHRGTHRFPLSEEWQAWAASNDKKMDQADFAAFLEDRILDVLPAPAPGTMSPELLEIERLLRGTWAGPERMMELARGLTVHEASKVGAIVNLASGEGSITFETEHQTANGEKLTVPNLFLVGIPVFENAPERFQVAARLRYRKGPSGIGWFYQLYRPDRVFKTAFREACERAARETGLPLFYGTPEA